MQITAETDKNANVSVIAGSGDAHAASRWLTPGWSALILGLLVFASFSAVLLGKRTFVFRDFGLFSYPVAFFHKESFWRGELPLWNPYNYCGIPFLAQWNTMVLYPASLIYVLLPLTWSLPFFCVAHLWWGGLGMYYLAHNWTKHRLASALAGVIFSFNGLSLNFLMWPSHIATFAWLPWVLWLVPEGWRRGGKYLVLAVLIASLQMLAGGPETILFTWTVLLLLVCGEWLGSGRPGTSLDSTIGRKKEEDHSPLRRQESRFRWRRRILPRFVCTALLVFMVCAAQLLPFLQLLLHSQRDSSYGTASHNWAIPPWGWANFLVPIFRTSATTQGVHLQNIQGWTSSYYAGIGTVFLAALALRYVKEWKVRLISIIVGISLILAWGDLTLLFQAIQKVFPLIGFVRYPVKFIIPVLALLPLLAAFGLKSLMHQDNNSTGRFERICFGLLVCLIAGIVALEWGTPAETWRTTLINGASRAAFLTLIFGLLQPLRASFAKGVALGNRVVTGPAKAILSMHGCCLGPTRAMVCGALLLLAFWFDLATHVPLQNPTVSPHIYAASGTRNNIPVEQPGSSGFSRVMLSASLRRTLQTGPLLSGEENFWRNRMAARGNANMLDAIAQMDGFFSLVPGEIFKLAALPYSETRPEIANLLDFMAISRIAAVGTPVEWHIRPGALPLVTAGQQPLLEDQLTAYNALVADTNDFRQVVFLPPEARSLLATAGRAEVSVKEVSASGHGLLIEAETPTPTLMVVAQTFYPAWQAFVDRQRTTIWRANYAFQAIYLPKGKHTVRVAYNDRTFRLGVLLSMLGCLLSGGLWLVSSHRWKRL